MEKPTIKLLVFLGQKVAKHLDRNGRRDLFAYPTLTEVKNFFKTSGVQENRSVSNALYYLKKRKYIKIFDDGDEDQKVALTVLGTRQFLKYCSLTDKKPVKVGSSSLVILSVPEGERHYRDFLRNKLTDEGFVLLNNGVYSANRKFSIYLPFLVKILGLEKYVLWGEFRQSSH